MEPNIRKTRYGLGQVIAAGWRQYRRHFAGVLFITLVVYIPVNLALALVSASPLGEGQGLQGFRLFSKLVQLSEFFVGVLATMAIAKLAESSLQGQPVTWRASLRHALARWPASLSANLLTVLIVAGLLLLLVVPGIIWSVYYVFVVYAVALRGLSGKKALDYSKSLVKGHWWEVFAYLFVIQLLGFLAGFLVAAPLAIAPDHLAIRVLSDTLVDVAYAMTICMITVYFLNNDYLEVRPAPPFQAKPAP
jgi:hypothetical protein